MLNVIAILILATLCLILLNELRLATKKNDLSQRVQTIYGTFIFADKEREEAFVIHARDKYGLKVRFINGETRREQ